MTCVRISSREVSQSARPERGDPAAGPDRRRGDRAPPPARSRSGWHDQGIDDVDIHVRNATYALFVELGRAPRAEEVAEVEQATPAFVEGAWRRLHDAHALVLHASGDIRMANPFSAVPTAHRVLAAGRWWYASCAWDALGICAALDVDGDVESSCPDCGEAMHVHVRERRPSDASLLFHCLVPAVAWWDDIVFT